MFSWRKKIHVYIAVKNMLMFNYVMLKQIMYFLVAVQLWYIHCRNTKIRAHK